MGNWEAQSHRDPRSDWLEHNLKFFHRGERKLVYLSINIYTLLVKGPFWGDSMLALLTYPLGLSTFCRDDLGSKMLETTGA